MTLEEYKERPFKYDGDCNPVFVKDIWDELTRTERREIERQLKKGKIPDIVDYL